VKIIPFSFQPTYMSPGHARTVRACGLHLQFLKPRSLSIPDMLQLAVVDFAFALRPRILSNSFLTLSHFATSSLSSFGEAVPKSVEVRNLLLISRTWQILACMLRSQGLSGFQSRPVSTISFSIAFEGFHEFCCPSHSLPSAEWISSWSYSCF